MSELPILERRQRGRNHSYRLDGEKLPGVTTIIVEVAS